MNLSDLLVGGSLGLQLVLWLRHERPHPATRLGRVVNALLRQPERTKLLLTAVHVVAVLIALNKGPNLLDLASTVRSSESVTPHSARPDWNDAFFGDMNSKPRLRDPDGRWRPVR